MSNKDDSTVSKYLMLLFNVSLGMMIFAFLFVLVDWYFFDEQHKEFIRPFGTASLVGFGIGVVATLLLRDKL